MSTDTKVVKDNLPVIQKQAAPTITQASSLVVTDAKTMATASELREKLKTFSKALTADKEKLTKPLNAALKEVRARYAPLEAQVDEAIDTLNSSMSKYQTEQKRITDAAAAKIAARVKEGTGNLKPETAIAKIAELDTPAPLVVTDAGATGFITVKHFEVVDISLLGKEYLLPNDKAIRESMKQGVELPGVRYYTTEEPRTR